MTWEQKLVTLPGVQPTAALVLHRTLDKLPRIKGVVVVIQWDTGDMSVDFSSLKTSELCMASMTLHDEVATIARTPAE